MRESMPSLSKTFAVHTLLLTAGLGLFAASADAQPSAEENAVTVEMMNTEGESVGTVEVEQLAQGALFMADLENLPAGGHGFHIHETGECKPTFKAAGGHYNPQDNKHGFDNPQGYHAGDLPDIYVADNGAAKAAFFSHQLVLNAASATESAAAGPFPLQDQDGSAIMIHQHADDYEATPSGSSGARIACGVIPAGS